MPEDFDSPSEHTVVFLVAPGDILDDRWLIETRIGRGAMGSVFRGRDTRLERPVAIKLLAPEHCRKPKVLARFEREATLMTTLRHPNIIQLFGVGRRGALPYIVMQFLEGMTLSDVLKRKGGRLSAGETMAMVKQIAAGLSFIHHHGLVHRDIKPQNIFVGPGGRVTILDLGVVRDKANPGLTRPGAMVGTPYYMSPEQILGTDEIDKRTDVYALAAMTFELLVGRPPFLGNTNFEVLHAHRYQPVPDASQLSKSVNKDVARAIATAMSKTREDRPLSASEFSADLEAFFGSTEKVDPRVAFAFLEEDARAQRTERVRSTRGSTLPRTNGPGEAGRSDERPPPPVERQRTSGDGEPDGPSDTFPGEATETLAGDETDQHGEQDTNDEDRGPPEPDRAPSDPADTVSETSELRIITTLKGLTSTATLFVDGQPQGTTPTSLQVPIGQHSVRVERQGCQAVEKQVVVAAGTIALVRIELGPKA